MAVVIRVVFTGAIALSQKGCHVKVHSDFKTEDRKAGKCPLEHPDSPLYKPQVKPHPDSG
jgi:hypothetical protein